MEAVALAQQATLETREAKHDPRTLDEQRATWQAQAEIALGSPQAVQAIVYNSLHPAPIDPPVVDWQWWENAAQRILARVEHDRSAWQVWHVRAEALRYARVQNVPADSTDVVVDWLTGHVQGHYSIPLTPDTDTITEPDSLRRADGASVYTIAGNRLYTSTRILRAEQRLVTHAGHTDGRTVTDTVVDLALLDSTATGIELNAGQAALVRAMATSGSRLQLAIAPAGSGKTSAMQALAKACTDSGGTVIGLATSAVAAAGLGEQIDAHADTIAKLAWHLTHGGAPDWMRSIGPDTLVIIDEAGMADTLSLDAVVTHVIGAGGSVRLIGDDQQLAAIGAGGVLRDIQASHGALQFSELVRFSDPAEGSASLALREGHPEALGFYLDRDRIHIGSTSSMLDRLFDNWSNDREAGRDSVMLAPTRDLVAQLNQRARSNRLAQHAPDVEVELADGNLASAGDVIITRRNDRSLRLNATDWVKNGDRWTIQSITTPPSTTTWPTGSPPPASGPDCPCSVQVKMRLGPNGRPAKAAKRKPYYTELVAYLASRPQGATSADLCDAFATTPARIHRDLAVVRKWLGADPATQRRYIPDAIRADQRSDGRGLYQLGDILYDADLFRRLRLRGQVRGADGLDDYLKALSLVSGAPYSELWK